MLELKNLKKEFENKTVLDIEHLKISQGSIFGVMGPSGAGKSTLLRIIGGLEKPSSGSIFFEGEKVPYPYKLSFLRKMTMVSQKPVLFSTTVFNNVYYGLKVRGKKKRDCEEVVMDAIETVGLKGKEKRMAPSLSGGEAQRIALARAFVIEPELLLMDEPTANLDPANVEIIENLLLDYNRRKNTTIIIVTHNFFQARRVCEMVALINNGLVVETGSSNKIFENPASPETEAFIQGRIIF